MFVVRVDHCGSRFWWVEQTYVYHKFSNITRTKPQDLNVYAQSIEARCYVKNEDVVGAAPTGDAPTTSE